MQVPISIQLTAEAEGDLAAIYNHRLKQRGADGPDGADALLDTLYGGIESLAEFPLRGPITPELDALGIAQWRHLSIWPDRIIYTLEGDRLTIAVVADSRRDFASLLERRLLQRAPRS